jgi:hypothetical protein
MKIPMIPRRALPILAVGLISACAASGVPPDGSGEVDAEASASEPAATRPPFTTTSPIESEPPIDGPAEVPDEIWPAVIEALDAELDGAVDASAVQLVSVMEVTWSDGSLGCPKPGEVYTQALVDGFRVVVELDGEEYDYRIPPNGEPRLCEGAADGG